MPSGREARLQNSFIFLQAAFIFSGAAMVGLRSPWSPRLDPQIAVSVRTLCARHRSAL